MTRTAKRHLSVGMGAILGLGVLVFDPPPASARSEGRDRGRRAESRRNFPRHHTRRDDRGGRSFHRDRFGRRDRRREHFGWPGYSYGWYSPWGGGYSSGYYPWSHSYFYGLNSPWAGDLDGDGFLDTVDQDIDGDGVLNIYDRFDYDYWRW